MRQLLPLALLLLAACAVAPDARPGRDTGGPILARMAQIAALEASRTPRRVEGRCLSACTLYLGLSTACFAPGAILGFHGPRLPDGSAIPEPQATEIAALMARYYPPRVAAWFMAEARHADRSIRVPAAELIARGEARACP